MYKGKELERWRTPRSGASYEPLFSYALAAHWWDYKWEHFCELDSDLQAFLIAVYETQQTLEAVISHQMMKRT